jgi:predicted DsbA family dithiol-disulfide isomerase
MGARAGLTFNFGDIPKAPNTALAHVLIALTPEEKRGEMVEALYDAFFQHGQDVGDPDVLLELAARLGLDQDAVRHGLADPAVREQVEAEVQAAYRMGITGVPFFLIDQKYAFSGAQPPEVILEVLRRVADGEMPA